MWPPLLGVGRGRPLFLVVVVVNLGIASCFWYGRVNIPGPVTTTTITQPQHPFRAFDEIARRSNPRASSSAGSWSQDSGSHQNLMYPDLLRLRWGSFPGGVDPQLESMGDDNDDSSDDDDFTDFHRMVETGEVTKVREFEVKLKKPLGLYLAEDGGGVIVSQVSSYYSESSMLM